MHLGLAGLLHFVRNDGILDYGHCNKASAAGAARRGREDTDTATHNTLSLRGGVADAAIQNALSLRVGEAGAAIQDNK
ncbi:MAG: hypothetical protein AWT59_2181 [Candidatus Gallionella acididurans]|uniref:Uncharacterized protein n=1 Tax=Candidatus Gallionella acididurans TaxID=1796491 RepID=A0A139BRV4_9PROT|nr:MAG: hypothetical protein AWT59_2181 [Candidatus Gallionella acididurans]